jgi:hypothetical protein
MEREEWVPMTSLMQQIIGLTYEFSSYHYYSGKFRVLDLKARAFGYDEENFSSSAF